MYNLKQKLGIKYTVLKLVIYVTNNKTSYRMIIYTQFFKYRVTLFLSIEV